MPLVSNLLRGDPTLEACLTHDAAHIFQGATGEHVARIQIALEIVDKARINQFEIMTHKYGASTAAAVLSFKSKRKLINVSYQRQADDIISKMTLAALDRELVTREKHQTPSFHCSDPVRSGVSGSSHSAVTPPRSVTFPADLDILWQPTSSAVGRASNHHLALLNKAIDLLQPYGISIVSSVTAPPDSPFPSTTPVDPRYKYDIFNVRREAEKARPGLPRVLRIIPCLFAPNSHEYGLTEGGGFDGVTFPDFILLNVNMRRVDECVVLHQMIHASGLWDHDESDPANAFSSGADRKHLKPEHAERLSKAYFARPR